jgi:hypothetical protein
MMKPTNAMRLLSQAALAAAIAIVFPAVLAMGCSSGAVGGGQTVGTVTGNSPNGGGAAQSNGSPGGASNNATGMPTAAPASTSPAGTMPAPAGTTTGTSALPPGTTTTTGTAAAACPTDSTLSVNGAAPAALHHGVL